MVRPQPARRPRPPTAAVVPGVERLRAGVECCHEPLGVQELVVVSAFGVEIQVLPRQLQAQVTGECAGALTGAGRVARLPGIAGGVQHRAGELAVVGPRAPVEVVAPHADPDVVDYAHLGVHVARRPLVVLHIEDVPPALAGPPAHLDRLPAPDVLRELGERAVLIGHPRTTTTRCRSGWSRSTSANSRATSADHMYWSSR